MKITLILASTLMLASAQYFDQIAMESGGETSPQYAYAAPVQQQQLVYQQPQQVYYSPAQQTYTVPLQGQAYAAPPPQLLSQQNYISQSETPTVVNIPPQVQQFSQYVSAPAPVIQQQTAYVAPQSQIVKVAPLASQATYVSPIETYNSQQIIRLKENIVAPENNQVYVSDATYAAPAPVVETYNAPPTVAKIVRNQLFTQKPVTVLKEVKVSSDYGARPQVSSNYGAPEQVSSNYGAPEQVSSNYGAPEQVSSNYGAPEPGFPATKVKTTKVTAGYGPPGYQPPAVLETYVPTAKMTDTYYGAPDQSISGDNILKVTQSLISDQPLHSYGPPAEEIKQVYGAPDQSIDGDSILKISQSLISEQPIQSYGPPEEIRQVYGVPEEPREHKHIYVHTAPQEAYSPKVRVLQPINQQPEKHYQIIFVRAPNPQNPVRTEIQLPPPPVQKTLVYVLTKSPESNHDVKISAPVPTKPSPPEVFFIRYAANAPSGGYGAPSGGYGAPSANLVKQPTQPRSLDVYAPDMSYSSYSTNANLGGYRKRDTEAAVKEEGKESQRSDAIAETNESKSSAE